MEAPHKTSNKLCTYFLNKFRSKSQKTDTSDTSLVEKKRKKTFFPFLSNVKRERAIEEPKESSTTKKEENEELISVNQTEKETSDYSIVLDEAKNLLVVPLNNSMAKSKIQAASKRKPGNFGNGNLKNTLDIIQESSSNLIENLDPLIEEMKKRKFSDALVLDPKADKTKSNESISSPWQSSKTNIQKQSAAAPSKKTFSPTFSSQENLIHYKSTENLLDAKKSLRNVSLSKCSKANLIYSEQNSIIENPSPGKFEFQQATLNKTSNSLAAKQYPSNVTIIGQQILKPATTTSESIRIPCSQSCDKLNIDITTSPSLKFELNIKTFSQKSEIDLNHNKSPEQHIPIYDNFTMLESPHKKIIEKSPSAPDSFVYKLNKKNETNKSDKMSLADKDPDQEEIQIFVRTRLRPTLNNSRSFEDLSNKSDDLQKKVSVQSVINEINKESPIKKQLVYSKSLKSPQSSIELSPEECSQIDFIHDPKKKASSASLVKGVISKIILVNKTGNVNEKILPEFVIENQKVNKVADLIKKNNIIINSEKNCAVPVWKDLVLKKKNSWIQQSNASLAIEKSMELEVKSSNTSSSVFPFKPANKVKSIIMEIKDK